MKPLKFIEINLDHIKKGLFLTIDGKAKNDSIFKVSDAIENGEAEHQIIEGCFYDYELNDDNYTIYKRQIVQPHSRKKHIGVIAPNIYVGTLSLSIYKKKKQVGIIDLEVRSVKTDYRKDYRDMLQFITEQCTDLLMQVNAPVTQTYETDFDKDSETRYQRFIFIQSIISTDEFSEAVHRIVTKPITQWEETTEQKNIGNIRRFSNSHIKELITSGNKTKLSSNHYLRNHGLQSVPNKITSRHKVDTVDTHENRFVKFALETFMRFCSDIRKGVNKETPLYKEAKLLEIKLETYLQHSLFKKISNPYTLKLNSPALQRQGGYREILRVWLMYDLAAKLVWKGGDDVYKGGKKDIATLYEYWLFFKLLDLLKNIFLINPTDISNLIVPTDDRLGLQLKQGLEKALEGIYNSGTREFNVCFYYNRMFYGQSKYPNSGSWTTSMRPDYTLSIWPKELNKTDAEKEELIVHIHFDAKYKVANFNELLESKSIEQVDTEKEDNKKGKYKNADLLKMHAYKDAIRRTGGAYILYPGSEEKTQQGFHEVIPGLGAFPVRPGKTDDGIGNLKTFILEVVNHLENRTSQREKIAFSTFDIYKFQPKKEDEVREILPETFGANRGLMPDNTYVLVGYCKSKEHYEWYLENGLYNFRMNDENGSLTLDESVVNAKYLLLRYKKKAKEIYKIKGEGIKVYSKSKLQSMDYPKVNREEYLIIEIEKTPTTELGDHEWDYKELNGYQEAKRENPNVRIHTGIPFTTTLTELMKTKVVQE